MDWLDEEVLAELGPDPDAAGLASPGLVSAAEDVLKSSMALVSSAESKE